MYPTDEELMDSFTPLESDFYRWTNDPTSSWSKCLPYSKGGKMGAEVQAVKNRWPHIKDVTLKFMDFSNKWISRDLMRERQPVSRHEFLTQVKNSNCADEGDIGEIGWTMMLRPVCPILLGEGHFNGTKTGYMLGVGPKSLCPTTATVDRQFGDKWLASLVLAIDTNIPYNETGIKSGPVDFAPRNPPSGPGEALTRSMRSTSCDDFNETKPPFSFLHIGSLIRCTQASWKKAKGLDPGSREFGQAWEPVNTRYGVAVRLDKNNRPTGAVYAIYRYWVMQDPNYNGEYSGPESVYFRPRKIEWRDERHQEYAHVRRLNPGCNEKFFMAKMYDSLEKLQEGGAFNFEVKLTHYKDLTRTKVSDSPQPMVIPTEIAGPSRS